MKIGILSLNPGHNYGGILQTYALQTVLERMGNNVSVISRNRYRTVWSPSMLFTYLIRLYRRVVLKRPVGICDEKRYNDWITRTYGKMLVFCSSKLHLRSVNSLSDIDAREFDAIVVGSDQVWRPRYFRDQFDTSITDAYLKFAQGWNIRRVAYATSFGVDSWEYTVEETNECARLLAKFDNVSVREQTGVRLCKKYFNIDANCLCDPTMLLTRNDYEQLVDVSTPHHEGDLLVYCLDESRELDLLVEKIKREYRFIPFNTNVSECASECQKESVESWIRGFMDAKFVITDSFHACVFALIFHKPFVVMGNNERGISRFENLLSVYHQEHRLLYKATDFKDSLLAPTFESVESIFETLRHQSMEFLKQSLQ